ncbi:MAG: methyltransferase domain-containing protein [Deltaproteobacteria bacterium]|nr:methyltransferase domain-containing protein [Deltaproteobacteria bacterium]
MQKFVLDDICCPARMEGDACHGRLVLGNETVTPVHARQDKDELVEGILACQDCGGAYPVLCGLPILVTDPWHYLWDRYDTITGLAREAGFPVGQTMDQLIRTKNADTAPRTEKEDKYESLATTHEYLAVHFDDFWRTLPEGHPFRAIVHDHYGSDFYSVAVGMLEPFLDPTMLALDLGCSVGRGVYELAGHCKLVYGVEFAFRSASVARRVLRHFPCPMNDYWLKFDGDIGEKRLLPDFSRDNVEIVVASAANLPFSPNSFGVTNSWNIIDRLADPEGTIAEQERVLRPEGILSLTSPYNWNTALTGRKRWIGGTKGVRTADAIRGRILQNFEILDEKAYIPWIFWIFERFFEVFFAHGLIARKR